MNIEIDTLKNPLLIGKTTTIKLTIEIGDVFIDKNNKVKFIKNFILSKAEFRDDGNNISFESLPLSKEFRSKYRYAGKIKDDEFPIYEDALKLND